jgi:CRP-like cAMP-binding protein
MSQLSEILSALPLFHTLDRSEIAELEAQTAHQTFAPNDPILVEGQPPPGLYILLSGKVAVMKHRSANAEADHITDLDGGECIGEVEIIDDAPCAASVVCYEQVETAVISKERLEKYLASRPLAANKILRQMVRVLASRLRQTNASYSNLKQIAETLE